MISGFRTAARLLLARYDNLAADSGELTVAASFVVSYQSEFCRFLSIPRITPECYRFLVVAENYTITLFFWSVLYLCHDAPPFAKFWNFVNNYTTIF